MLGKILFLCRKLFNRLIRNYELSLFHRHGKKVYIGRNCTFTYQTVELGNSVYIGNNCIIQSAHGNIKIGNHVMFGPGVNLHGGNHIMNQVGIYMDQVKKKAGDDPDLIVEDDVWIGANAIILGGVTIGKGSVVGAGTIVTKSVPPYSVVVGNPGKVIKKRFSETQIKEHETKLNYKGD